MTDHDDNALASFVKERLEALGLDSDTYAPYVLPLLFEPKNDDEESKDDDEWDSVWELLQASSETHSDDEQAWIDLRRDIHVAWEDHLQHVRASEEAAHAQRAAALQASLEEERKQIQAELERAAAELEKQKGNGQNKSGDDGDEDDAKAAAKRALVARYAFENDDDEDNTNKNNANGDEEAPLTNRQVAAQLAQEKAREMRGQAVQTKKEEQQKTAKAKMEKARLKEERRKRATKGERKR